MCPKEATSCTPRANSASAAPNPSFPRNNRIAEPTPGRYVITFMRLVKDAVVTCSIGPDRVSKRSHGQFNDEIFKAAPPSRTRPVERHRVARANHRDRGGRGRTARRNG